MQIDEHEAGVLLRLLDRDPREPSGVDIDRAVRDGIRRRTRRTARLTGAVALTVAALVAVPVTVSAVRGRTGPDRGPQPAVALSASRPPASPAARAPLTWCLAQALPVPDGVAMALVTAASPNGSIIFGRSYPHNAPLQVLMWHDGEATKIPVQGDDQQVNSVNDAGVAVGVTILNSTAHAWVYRDGKVTDLPGGDGAEPRAINADGVIVGNRAGTPLVWSSPTAQPTVVPVPDGSAQAQVDAIDDDGTMVGSIRSSAGTTGVEQAYVWPPDGSGRLLPIPSGVDTKNRSFASSVHHGWAAGGAGVTGVLWNLYTGESRVAVPFDGRPSDVNGSGWLVGNDAQSRAVLTMGTRQLVLPDLYPHQAGHLSLPTTMSEDGTVIGGQADDLDGVIRPVVWHCS